MGLKRFGATRPRICLMKMWKWDTVHKVGIKMPLVFVVWLQGELNFV